MSVLDSVFVGLFGMAVVFIVLIGLSLLVQLQSALVTRFAKRKLALAHAQDGQADEVSSVKPAANDISGKLASAEDGGTQHTVSPANLNTHAFTSRPISLGEYEPKRKFTATLNGKVYAVEVESDVEKDNMQLPYQPVSTPGNVNTAKAPVAAPPLPQTPSPKPVPAVSTANRDNVEIISAPVPGTVLEIKASVGAAVKCGNILVLLEAMKMENEIVATRDGIVTQVLTSKGATVGVGTPLLTIQ